MSATDSPLRRFADHVWFPEMPVERPALARLATGGYAMWLLWRAWPAYRDIARLPADRFTPVGPVGWLTAPVDPSFFDGWLAVTALLVVLYFVGFAHRVVAPVGAFMLLVLLAYRTSWGKVYHSDNLFCMQIICLSITPAASALSVDAWLARRFPDNPWLAKLRWPEVPPMHWWYGWSIQLVCTLTLITYFLAGWAKIMGDAGVWWATADNLLAQIGKNAIQAEMLTLEGPSDTVLWAYQMGALLGPAAFIALWAEVLAPLALLDRRLGWGWAVITWCMHFGIHVLMDISFKFPLYGWAFWPFFPMEKLLPSALRSSGVAAVPPSPPPSDAPSADRRTAGTA